MATGGAAAQTPAARLALRGMAAFRRDHPELATASGAVPFERAAAALAQARQSIGTAGAWYCYSNWVYFSNGSFASNTLRPESNGWVYADGNIHGDYWNQQFLPCQDSSWHPTHWAFLSNRSGSWLQVNANTWRVDVNSTHLGGWQLFQWCHVQPWVLKETFRSVGNGKFVSAKHDIPHRPVFADASTAGAQETFILERFYEREPVAC